MRALGPQDYSTVSRAAWDFINERLKFAVQVQADYGKWLIVTIMSVHLAGLFLLSQNSVPEAVRHDPASYWPFITGICLALLCGLFVWTNFTLSCITLIKMMNPMMLVDQQFLPQPPSVKIRAGIYASMAFGLALGIASACCVPWGATVVLGKMPAKVVLSSPPVVASPKATVPVAPKPANAAKPK